MSLRLLILIRTNYRKHFKISFCFLFALIILFCFQYFSGNKHRSKNAGVKLKLDYLRNEEIVALLSKTPDLWRNFEIDFSDKVESNYENRVKAQRNWIKRLSKTEFIKEARVKKILLQYSDAGYMANTKMVCPYAHKFSSKCQLIVTDYARIRAVLEQNATDEIKSLHEKEGLRAVVGNRNGYWDWGLKEPLVPEGVIQIFHVTESPCHTNTAQLGVNNALLASYWRGSDIPTYAYWKKYPGQLSKTEWNEFRSSLLSKNGSGSVAALISNCQTVKNNRREYIAELQKYISVDVYGACGTLKCPDDLNCKEWLGQHYKFYLAFENCNCVDYISEKISSNALKNEMIPIVMGAPRVNYELFAPPGSFIHVEDFPSVEALAQHLHELEWDVERYLKYWEWRKSNWGFTNDAATDLFCRICGLLFYADFTQRPKWPKGSTSWADVNKCAINNNIPSMTFILNALVLVSFGFTVVLMSFLKAFDILSNKLTIAGLP